MRSGFNTDFSSELVYDSLGDIQAKSDALKILLLSRAQIAEHLEKIFLVFLLNAYSVVDDAESNLAHGALLGNQLASNQNLTFARCELYCVTLIVQQYLLKTHLIGVHFVALAESQEFRFEVDLVEVQLVSLYLHDLVDC